MRQNSPLKASSKDISRADDVIGRIHNFAKKSTPKRDTLDINGAILEVIPLTRTEAIKHGVTVQMRLADDLPQVKGDKVQLQQVMINLIMNAIEAMSDASDGTRDLLIGTEQRQGGRARRGKRIPVPGSRRRRPSISLTPSTRQNPAGWAWGYRSAGPSSMTTAGFCGRAPTSLAVPCFNSLCPPTRMAHRHDRWASPSG